MSTTKIQITSIVCNGTSEDGNDEVYVIHQSDAGVPVRYPAAGYQRMNTTADPSDDVVQTWSPPDLTMEFTNEVLVTLWDQDVRGTDPSFLINNDYTPSDVPSSFSMHNHNGAEYTIYAQIVS